MRWFAAIAVLSLLAPPLQAQKPLPDQQAFLQEVRKHLDTDEDRQTGYMYMGDFPNLWNFPGFEKVCHAIPRIMEETEYRRRVSEATVREKDQTDRKNEHLSPVSRRGAKDDRPESQPR